MTILAALACLVWAWLWLFHGRFWQAGPVLRPARPADCPPVDVVIPARNEAESIAASVRSVLTQDYAGPLRVIVVDDRSTDNTGALARATGRDVLARPGGRDVLVIDGQPRPDGWSGKLWAVSQGVARAEAPYVLLTDADILHDPAHVGALVAKAEADRLDLVSEMVELRCASAAERALVPAFVFFFQMLYPFARVNDPRSATAAAAGGTMLVRASALARIGGIARIRGRLIDDVALAAAIKEGGTIWLGHSMLARSVRPYPGPRDIWRMVARTAYVQLRRSPLVLAGTVAGLAVVWLAGPFAAVAGHGAARWLGIGAYLASAGSVLPTLRRFRQSPAWALLMPAVATFYLAATVGSAVDHHRGRGARWKDRAYTAAHPDRPAA